MKTLLRLMVGLSLAACFASGDAELSPVSFVLGKQQFELGDSIVIDQILATTATLEVGARVVVRGHYKLGSSAKAKLGLFITHRSAAGADASAGSQTTLVEDASGSFELACEIKHIGNAHVSFYPATGGRSFGGVYFSTAVPES